MHIHNQGGVRVKRMRVQAPTANVSYFENGLHRLIMLARMNIWCLLFTNKR